MRKRSALAVTLMCLAVVAVYFPLREHPGDNTQMGGDFHTLHARRMAFARENLAERKSLPAWYPRELMGSPFWANVQNFPLIPTRLALLPIPLLHAYTVGVILSAVLTAVFTFLFLRSIGIGVVGAAMAGWTFACGGFYAARVASGELPLFEGYPALPLLLWLVEVNLRTMRPATALAALAAASLCLALAGHPQLPMYGFVVAGLYLICRGWGAWRRIVQAGLTMGLGLGCAAIVLWPASQLIGRSTRVLTLVHERNNVAMPYSRLLALVLPWKDGAPVNLGIGGKAFTAFSDHAYFYETVTYVGLFPLVAAVALGVRMIVRRRRPSRVGMFFTVVAILAAVTALPLFHPETGQFSTTILRNPVRQNYVATFALAVAAGVGADMVGRISGPRRRVMRVLLALLLLGHVVDLTLHDRAFIHTAFVQVEKSEPLESQVRRLVGSGRAAIDYNLTPTFNRQIDDVGFFDSILLARPYVTLLDWAGAPPGFNVQQLNGSDLRPRALAAAGVRFVMTLRDRPQLEPMGEASGAKMYAVPNPTPRAMFFPASAAVARPPSEIHRRMREAAYRSQAELMLPVERAGSIPQSRPSTNATSDGAIRYERLNSDEIVIRVRCNEPGFVRVLESFDPGWRAESKNASVDVFPADDTFLCVAVPAGETTIRFTYHTPGVATGAILSIVSASLLAGFLFTCWRHKD
jgi:hypothetical protein